LWKIPRQEKPDTELHRILLKGEIILLHFGKVNSKLKNHFGVHTQQEILFTKP